MSQILAEYFSACISRIGWSLGRAGLAAIGLCLVYVPLTARARPWLARLSPVQRCIIHFIVLGVTLGCVDQSLYVLQSRFLSDSRYQLPVRGLVETIIRFFIFGIASWAITGAALSQWFESRSYRLSAGEAFLFALGCTILFGFIPSLVETVVRYGFDETPRTLFSIHALGWMTAGIIGLLCICALHRALIRETISPAGSFRHVGQGVLLAAAWVTALLGVGGVFLVSLAGAMKAAPSLTLPEALPGLLLPVISLLLGAGALAAALKVPFRKRLLLTHLPPLLIAVFSLLVLILTFVLQPNGPRF